MAEEFDRREGKFLTDLHRTIQENHHHLLSALKIHKLRFRRFNRYNQKRDVILRNPYVMDVAHRLRKTKENAIQHLLELTKIAQDAFSARGATVYFADTAKKARKIALEIIGDARSVVQSSTDLINEIALDRALREVKIPLIQTTATYRLVQKTNFSSPLFDRPSPVEHLSSEEAQHLVSTVFQETPPLADPLQPIRQETTTLIQQAPIGITGANAVAAYDGAFTLAYSQGNTTLVASRPTHLAIIGIEKIVPYLPEAMDATYLQGLFESGVNGARFYHIIGGPSRFPGFGKYRSKGYTTENLHILFVDNHRFQIATSPYRELLYCIRCFTCIHHCPAYTALGPGLGPDLSQPGFGYQGYVGGREIALNGLTQGMKTAVLGGLYGCTMCGACKTECPLDIDIPSHIQKLRSCIYNE